VVVQITVLTFWHLASSLVVNDRSKLWINCYWASSAAQPYDRPIKLSDKVLRQGKKGNGKKGESCHKALVGSTKGTKDFLGEGKVICQDNGQEGGACDTQGHCLHFFWSGTL
jgi:hypothetical protein